uniref:Uncharacterized protein n=1 Tax=Ixodes ricinus TaxID=34613 RepID=A0A0K8RCM5_IXORI
MKNMKHQRNEFIMSVGKHSANVICRNKRDGKQRASQAILRALHPHITSWGSLLRLYGKGSCKTLKERRKKSSGSPSSRARPVPIAPTCAYSTSSKKRWPSLRSAGKP